MFRDFSEVGVAHLLLLLCIYYFSYFIFFVVFVFHVWSLSLDCIVLISAGVFVPLIALSIHVHTKLVKALLPDELLGQ